MEAGDWVQPPSEEFSKQDIVAGKYCFTKTKEAIERNISAGTNVIDHVDDKNQKRGVESVSRLTYTNKSSISVKSIVTESKSEVITSTVPSITQNAEFIAITDQFIRNFYLDGNNFWKAAFPKEILVKFLVPFANQIEISSHNVENKLNQQLDLCQKQQRKYLTLIKDISVRLRDHKCIGATDPINPVFILLEDVRFLLHEIIHSANVLGMIKYDKYMAETWMTFSYYIMSMNCKRKELEKRKKSRKNILRKDHKIDKNQPEKNQLVDNQRFYYRYLEIGLRTGKKIVKVAAYSTVILMFILSSLSIFYWYCNITHDQHICFIFDYIVKINDSSH